MGARCLGWRSGAPLGGAARRKRDRCRRLCSRDVGRTRPREHLARATQRERVSLGNVAPRRRDAARCGPELRLAEPLGELHLRPARTSPRRSVLPCCPQCSKSAQCGVVSSRDARGWRGVLAVGDEDVEHDEAHEVASPAQVTPAAAIPTVPGGYARGEHFRASASQMTRGNGSTVRFLTILEASEAHTGFEPVPPP